MKVLPTAVIEAIDHTDGIFTLKLYVLGFEKSTSVKMPRADVEGALEGLLSGRVVVFGWWGPWPYKSFEVVALLPGKEHEETLQKALDFLKD